MTEFAGLFEAFRHSAEAHSSRVALVAAGGEGPTVTYRELLDGCLGAATGLLNSGLIDSTGLGLLSENRSEWPEAYLAILAAGGTVIPIDANAKPEEVIHIVQHSGLRTLICSGSWSKRLASKLKGVTTIDFDLSGDGGWGDLKKPMLDLRPTRSPNDVAAIIYTSGTTGAPKAVELSHCNLLSNLQQIRGSLQFDHRDVFLSLLPLHHTFEATCGFLTPLTSGSRIVYARSYKSREIVEDIKRSQATLMVGVPLLYEKMYLAFKRRLGEQTPIKKAAVSSMMGISGLGWRMKRNWGRPLFSTLREKAGMSSIRMLISGGAPLPPHIARFFHLIGLTLLQGYGMTECSPVLAVNRPEDVRFDSVGPPVPGLDLRIDQPDSQGVGQILVRGDNNTIGYRGNPEETANLFTDGWLNTGDLGHLSRGHLYITGRAKNVIVSAAGKNIHPEELEEKLLESEAVLEALVYGQVREGRQGEDVCAILVPDLPDVEPSPDKQAASDIPQEVQEAMQKVVEQVNTRVAGYKRIARFEVRLEELEKTSTRKVKRFVYSKGIGESKT